MRILYDLFFLVFSVFYLPVMFFRGRIHGGLPQRFGFLTPDMRRHDRPVWIHAVSVGEAVLAVKLARALKKRFHGVPVVVSTTTRTGMDMVTSLKGRSDNGPSVDAAFYYPLDLSFVVSRVLKAVGPRLYIMVETEIWPNMLEGLKALNVPVVMANGRISDGSFANYRRFRWITSRMLGCVDSFCMQSRSDARRIEALGACAGSVSVTGNMKFDEDAAPGKQPRFSKRQLGFGDSDEVLVAGSTHFPEEQGVIDAYKELAKERKGLKLVIAPRHVERADAIRIYLEKSGLDHNSLSEVLAGGVSIASVLLVDTIGHLKELYGVATAVIVGGSFARKGGQNPIEPARWGRPVIFGPDMSNFREVADIFLEKKAALRVEDFHGLVPEVRCMLSDPGRLEMMSGNALKVIEENSGAIGRTVEELARYLGKGHDG